MRIALIAGGLRPIPPDGWGAVENIIWNYKQYYAFDRFDYSVMVKDYERIIHEFRDYYPCQKRRLI